MKKLPLTPLVAIATVLLSFNFCLAGIPKGYKSTDQFEEVRAQAQKKKKLITILFKGSDDRCPNCAATVANGTKAVKSYSELLFTRVRAANNNKTGLPEKITTQVPRLMDGSSVYFYVFNPETLELVTKGSRKELQSNKKTIRAFKDTVKEAKKNLGKL